MQLFGVNEVATRTAKLVALAAPTSYRGEKTQLEGSFQNTGNVPYRPRASVEVRPISRGNPRSPTSPCP